jgi:hypothetical protein
LQQSTTSGVAKRRNAPRPSARQRVRRGASTRSWRSSTPKHAAPFPRITAKPPVPPLALWSRKDGLIAPRAARGLEGERDKAVEMECTHMEFGVSRKTSKGVVREVQEFLHEIEPSATGRSA